MTSLQIIELFAGHDPSGKPVVEKIPVKVNEDDTLQLVKSPGFTKGLAGGDTIRFLSDSGEFEVVKRSGNLSIAVFCRGDMEELVDGLIPELEKLGGELDTESPRMLVFTIHVSCGFKKIESILNDHVGDHSDSAWVYGNVYDPADGVSPLNWWQAILKPE